MAHPNSCPIYDLLGCTKGLVPTNDDCRISRTQGSNRLSERHFDEGLVLMVYQKTEALNQNNPLK